MKKHNIFIAAGLLLLSTISCSKFDDINTNPEASEKVTSAMLATRIILNLANQPSQKSFLQPYMLNKNIVWTEFVEGYQYNGFGEASISLTAINDAHYMIEFAGTEELASSYLGLMHFARAVKFFEATMRVGDIPYHDALKGESEKNYFPKFDTQKEVFLGILEELEVADKAFSEGADFDGDPIYNGSTLQWRKLVNSYTLHVLMHLSKKEGDVELDVKNRFAQILANKPLFESNADNYQLIRSDQSGQQYPFYKVGNNFTIYPVSSAEVINPLKQTQDRRLFYYAHPSEKQIANGLTESDFDAYVGIDPSLVYDQVLDQKNTGDFSRLNDRYMEIPEGEPTQKLSYSQFCFIIAEAAARGWVTESAEEWYKKGVEASMKFIFDNTPNNAQFHHNMPLDEAYISSFVGSLTLGGSLENKVEQIITQKYLASYLHSEFNTYFDYRRTGYPKWKINPASSLNSEAPDRIPVRWRYPQDEFTNNSDNVREAVHRQYNGKDDINALMWILK